MIQANGIGVCTRCSSPSTASALGLFFVALCIRESVGGMIVEGVKDKYLDLSRLTLKAAIPRVVVLTIAPFAYRNFM